MRRKRSLKTSRESVGWWFILPWVIGFILFFLQPIVNLVQLSFSKFELTEYGLGLRALDNLWANYARALTEDSTFPTYLIESLTGLLMVPFTVFFSLISGLLLSHQFKGRTGIRVIFFLPLIISASVVTMIMKQSTGDVNFSSGNENTSMFNTVALMNMLLESGFPQQIVDLLTQLITNIADLVWRSTVQTFLFLIALLAVPHSYYEVAQIEGATAWESFWKVTFPVCLPFVLINTIYTIIDSFSSMENNAMRYISDNAIKNLQYDFAAAMSWIYFLIMMAVLGLIFLAFQPFLKSAAKEYARPAQRR